MSKNKKIYKEVYIIRLALIILLILYHSFAPYCGSWKAIGQDGYGENIEPYYWIALLSYSFMLETFVFISGYLFGSKPMIQSDELITHKTSKLLKINPYIDIVLNKAKRLLIPSLLFSFLYMLFFRNDAPFTTWIPSITEGVGHLWFLPMLFWCFIFIIIIDCLKISPKVAFTIILFLSIFSLLKLPLRINQSFNYLIFFYSGYILNKYNMNLKKYAKPKTIVALWIIFTLTVVIGIACKPYFGHIYGISNLISKVVKFIYASNGCAAIFLSAYYLANVKKIIIAPTLIKLSALCFGVYIFQEFILQYLYYHSTILTEFHPIIIPWIAFALTMILSLLLTIVVRSNKYGKLLLG